MASANTFPVDQLSATLAEIVTKVESNGQCATARYDTLEASLRNAILDKCEATWDQPSMLSDLLRTWKAARDICIHLLIDHDMELCRRLPFLILEDIVESLFGQTLKDFWVQAKPSESLCQGVIWTPSRSNMHVLQFIKACNRLLKRFEGQDEWVGLVLLDLARILPMSDKSSTKIYGSVSSDSELAIDSSQQADSSLDYSLYQSFWSVQQDFSNPYKIEFGPFINKMRVILAGLEGTSNQYITTGSLDFLTNSRLFHVQLQDASLKIHFLTQFLIIDAFLSTMSPNFASTLQVLTKRAKDLLQQMVSGEYLTAIYWLLTEREEFWRSWKQNKCKPDFLELALPATSKNGSLLQNRCTNGINRSSGEEDEFLKEISMEELAKVSREMGKSVPDVFDFLDDYKEALDPEAGIDAEYHPKNDKLFSWRAMRLLGKKHLGNFKLVQKGTGDFENLVRHIYKAEKNVDIPGHFLPSEGRGNDDTETNAEQNREGREVQKLTCSEGAIVQVPNDSIADIEPDLLLDAVKAESKSRESQSDEKDANEKSIHEVEEGDNMNIPAADLKEEETQESRKARYTDGEVVEHTMANNNDPRNHVIMKRENKEARKERQEDTAGIVHKLILKKSEGEDATRRTQEDMPESEGIDTTRSKQDEKLITTFERKRTRSRSPPPKKDIRPRHGQPGEFARDKLTDNQPFSKGGRQDNKDSENLKDEYNRIDSRSNIIGHGPSRDDTRRPEVLRNDPRGGRDGRMDFRESQSRVDQRREFSRDERRSGTGGIYRDDRGATSDKNKGYRDEYRRGN